MKSYLQKFYQYAQAVNSLEIVYKNKIHASEDIINSIASYVEYFERQHIYKNQRIAFVATNEINSIYIFFSLLAIGAIPVLIDNKLKLDVINKLIEKEDAVICDYLSLNHNKIIKIQSIKKDIKKITKSQKQIIFNKIILRSYHYYDPIFITHTSGTTGIPKKVIYSEKNILWACKEYYEIYNLKNNYGISFILPFHYCLGIIACCLVPMLYQKRILLTDNEDASVTINQIQNWDINILTAFPNFYRDLLRINLNDIDFNSLRICDCGGEVLPIAIIERFKNLSNITITEGYGQTETSSLTHFLLPDKNGHLRLGSVGKPCRKVSCKIVDVNLEEVSTGEIGELLVRGPMLMKGYDSRKLTKESIINKKWFKTGDLFYKDDDDYYYLVARKNDIKGVPPEKSRIFRLFEEIIYKNPFISEGTYILNKNDKITILLIPQNTQDTYLQSKIKFSIEKEIKLLGYAIPHIKFVNILPRTATGKIKKIELFER